MKAIILAATVAMLAGCSTSQTIRTATERAAVHGAELNDDILNAAEFTICYGASVGSIRRRFGNPERAVVWQGLCNPEDNFTP